MSRINAQRLIAPVEMAKWRRKHEKAGVEKWHENRNNFNEKQIYLFFFIRMQSHLCVARFLIGANSYSSASCQMSFRHRSSLHDEMRSKDSGHVGVSSSRSNRRGALQCTRLRYISWKVNVHTRDTPLFAAEAHGNVSNDRSVA